MKKAIVLDGHLRSALAAVRSLGKAGYHVLVGSDRRAALACYSRYARERFIYPSPLMSRSAFLKEVAERLGSIEIPILYSFSDATSLAILRSENGNLFGAIPRDSIETAFSKLQTVRLAEQLAIAVPKTHTPRTEADLHELGSHVNYPVVVKPEHTASWRGDVGVVSRVAFATSAKNLATLWKGLLSRTGECPIIQEYIPGTEYGMATLSHQGNVTTYCAYQRVRSLSPLGGASAVRVTVDPPEGMLAASKKILKALSWTGPAMIEFRIGSHDRQLYLVEINGRWWGSLALPVHAGMDFPVLFAQQSSGGNLTFSAYRRGVYSRFLLGDMKQLLDVWTRRGDSLGKYPDRWRATKEFLTYGGKDHFYDVESWSDPLPALVDVIGKLV